MYKTDKTPLLNSEEETSIPLGIVIPDPESNRRSNSNEQDDCDCSEMCIDCATCLFLSTLTVVAFGLIIVTFL